MNHSGTFLAARSPDEVFDLLAKPEQFAPLLPDFQSMSMLDHNHFSLRIVIALGEMSGYANLAMELTKAERPGIVSYVGHGIVAGSQLNLVLQFRISPIDASTEVSSCEVNWEGQFTLDGGLAFMMGSLIQSMGRNHFERLGERLRQRFNPVGPAPDVSASPDIGP